MNGRVDLGITVGDRLIERIDEAPTTLDAVKYLSRALSFLAVICPNETERAMRYADEHAATSPAPTERTPDDE